MSGNNVILNYQDILHFVFEFYIEFQTGLKVENNEGFIFLKMFFQVYLDLLKAFCTWGHKHKHNNFKQ